MENLYKKMLVAIDFSPNIPSVIKKAQYLANHIHASIIYLHVIEPSIQAEHIYVDPKEYKTLAIKEAKQKIRTLSQTVTIDENQCLIEFGQPKATILQKAKENQSDLIIIGSHDHHGLGKLIGSTANTIIHEACCDVIVVRNGSQHKK